MPENPSVSSPIIQSLDEALTGVRAIFCDVWGVLHNGVAAFPPASTALVRARAAGVPVVLLSNAPRPGANVLPQLASLGVRRDAFDDIVTSGDVCRNIIADWRPKRFHHIGAERDRPLFAGLDIEQAGPESAEYLLCTGLFDDVHETPDDYRQCLGAFARRGLHLLCANPDLVIDRGGQEVYCAGALAQLYETLGGTTTVIGKPFRTAYEHALKKAETLIGGTLVSSDILAIGDSFRTDIAGASGFGAKSLFVAAGIHAGEFFGRDGSIDPARALAAIKRHGFNPDYIIDNLR